MTSLYLADLGGSFMTWTSRCRLLALLPRSTVWVSHTYRSFSILISLPDAPFATNRAHPDNRGLRKIDSTGKHQANDLYTRGARTLSDLSAPSNPYNLSTGQLTGVALYDDLNTRIPRAECKAIFDLVRMHATRIDTNVWIEIMGSYRRGAENSGDVDILITRDTEDGRDHAGVMRRLVGGLVERGVITHEVGCLACVGCS